MNDKLSYYFRNHKDEFDIEEPTIGHFNRFEEKLKRGNQSNSFPFRKILILAAAASVVLFIGIGIGFNFSEKNRELAEVSPEMRETQTYFSSVINQELEKVKAQKTTYNEKVISDAMAQLQLLEENYTKLTYELYKSNEDQRIIYAMITNFQQRIQLLETLLNQLDTINQLKEKNYETHV